MNVIEGQFAIIRGLEDRYSSTTYNGAPVPSPDPDSQSVQLDLFPSEIISNLEVAKTFVADLPGNSSGGNINITTLDYPEEPFVVSVKAGTGFEDRARGRVDRNTTEGLIRAYVNEDWDHWQWYVGDLANLDLEKKLASNQLDHLTERIWNNATAANRDLTYESLYWVLRVIPERPVASRRTRGVSRRPVPG